MDFIKGAELIIHNAPFDVGFINHEFHPSQKNNLDALCKRYNIDNSNRQLHAALLDSEILAEVYLAMTGGQVSLLIRTTSTIFI